VVTVSTGEASLIADLAPSAGLDLPPIPEGARTAILDALPTMGFISNPLDPWGAGDTPLAYGAAFEAMAASDAYDVLVLVHDFPYRSFRRGRDATRLPALLDATVTLWLPPVYVSLVGEPPPETKGALDERGRCGAALRGAGVSSGRSGPSRAGTVYPAGRRWPWRAGWRAARARCPFGLDATARLQSGLDVRACAHSAREPRPALRAARLAVTLVVAVPDADAAVEVAPPPVHAVVLDRCGRPAARAISAGPPWLRGDDAVSRAEGPVPDRRTPHHRQPRSARRADGRYRVGFSSSVSDATRPDHA
jgi:hypothetical protein